MKHLFVSLILTGAIVWLVLLLGWSGLLLVGMAALPWNLRFRF